MTFTKKQKTRTDVYSPQRGYQPPTKEQQAAAAAWIKLQYSLMNLWEFWWPTTWIEKYLLCVSVKVFPEMANVKNSKWGENPTINVDSIIQKPEDPSSQSGRWKKSTLRSSGHPICFLTIEESALISHTLLPQSPALSQPRKMELA